MGELEDFFWKFMTEESGEYTTQPFENHIFSFVLLFPLFIYSIFIMVKSINNLRKAELWRKRLGYETFLHTLGYFLLILNFFLIRLSLILTNGQFAFMTREKGLIGIIGLWLVTLAYFSSCFNIIYVKQNVLSRINKLLIIQVLFGLLSVVLSVLAVLELIPIIFLRIGYGFSALFTLISLGGITILLFREFKSKRYSKFKQYRILFLMSSGIFVQITIYTSSIYLIAVTFLGDSGFFIMGWSAIERTLTMFFAITLQYLAYFFPISLQKRLQIIKNEESR